VSVSRVGMLNKQFNMAFNPAPKLMEVPAPAFIHLDQKAAKIQHLQYVEHERQLIAEQENVLKQKQRGELDDSWAVRTAQRYPTHARIEAAHSKLAREMMCDASPLRSELRVRAAVREQTGGSQCAMVTKEFPTEYRSQTAIELAMRHKAQNEDKLGPQPGMPKATMGHSVLRSHMQARLAIARDGFTASTAKYEPAREANACQTPKRLDILSQLQSLCTGVDKLNLAGLYAAFRALVRDTGIEEYKHVDHDSQRLCKIDFCRAVVKAKLAPTMAFSAVLFDSFSKRSNSERCIGGMDPQAFVAGWAPLGRKGGLDALDGHVEWLYAQFATQHESDKALAFGGLVQLVSWVYDLIGWNVDASGRDSVHLWDLVEADDDGVTLVQLQKGVRLLTLREKVTAAAEALWERVEGLQSEALKGDPRSVQEHMNWLQAGITTGVL